MTGPTPQLPKVAATVTEVLPALGLAYLDGDDDRAWTVTKSTPGVGLHELQPGKRVALTLARHQNFCVVSRYVQLD